MRVASPAARAALNPLDLSASAAVVLTAALAYDLVVGERAGIAHMAAGLAVVALVVATRSRRALIVDRDSARRDRTAAVAARDELEKRLHGLESIVFDAHDAVCRTDLGGTITHWNAAAERLYGYTAAEAIGMSATVLAPADRRGEIRGLLDRVARGETIHSFETVRVRKDGERVDVSQTLMPVRDPDGTITGLAAIVRELTERKRLEQQLRQAQKMEAIGQLAGGVAHDFNNSLMAIRGSSELILNRLDPGDPVYADAEAIQKAADSAAGLTRQLLAFSRQQVLQPRLLDLNAVVRETEDMLARLVGSDIELRTSLGEDLSRVKADPIQLEQVLVNLVLNARDAMPNGGVITIETTDVEIEERTHDNVVEPGSYTLLAVSDTGCGMSPEIRQRAFEPFFTTKGPGKGTGMGLSSVYGIVKQSGGYIWIYSEPGSGSTFKIYLPSARGELVLGPGRSRNVESAPGGAETILLAEDDATVRRLVRQMLERKGYTVLEAADGEDALRIAAEHSGDLPLVVSDVVMPKVSGPDFAARLRELRPETSVLFVSGYTDAAIVQRGMLDDAVLFIQKPFTAEMLARRVRAILDGSSLAEQSRRVSAVGGPTPLDWEMS